MFLTRHRGIGRAPTTYPWRLELKRDARSELKGKDRVPEAETDPLVPADEVTGVHLPYFYARPREVSNTPTKTPYTRMMLPSQEALLKTFAPNNRALLALFFMTFEKQVASRADDEDYIRMIDVVMYWCGMGSGPIRKAVARICENDANIQTLAKLDEFVSPSLKRAVELHEMEHATAAQLRELLTLLRVIDVRSANVLTFKTNPWNFFRHTFFVPQLAMHLPVGLVLFEGRNNVRATERLLSSPMRKEPFSSSWHPNVALFFLAQAENDAAYEANATMSRESYGSMLLIHKVMSEGILGFDTQRIQVEANEWETPTAPYPLGYHECEIIVQPLVKFHMPTECILQIQKHDMFRDHELDKDEPASDGGAGVNFATGYYRTMFTHMYLGDECPCQAKPTPASVASAAAAAAHFQFA